MEAAALNPETTTDEEAKTDSSHDQGDDRSVDHSDTSVKASDESKVEAPVLRSRPLQTSWAGDEENDVGRNDAENDTLEALRLRRMAWWAR